MPSPSNLPLHFHRDRTERQLDARLDELLEKLRKNRSSEDPWMVRRAYEIAAERHRDQLRSSGDPYLTHLLEVGHILADMRLDAITLTAALLHDAIEDTEYPVSRIEERFGVEVARLVEGVTKIGRLNIMAPEARQAESVRKMLLAMVNDVRVVLVKLADRLHNMRTLEYLEPGKQQRISRETLDIYAPIAHRLGMGIVRNELEDLSFRFLEPESFLALQKEVSDKAPVHKKFLEEVQATIRSKLVENGIPAELEARVKGLYSLHRKIVRQERSLEQVYDLLAVRVISDSERNCYAALGVVHHIWRPVPGRFKDYIAMARPNLYQSLHTTVLHGGQPFEVQIRTQEMHRIAEEGVAAHWKYKDGKPEQEDDQRITWMRQLIEWSQELEEPGEFLSTLKIDLQRRQKFARLFQFLRPLDQLPHPGDALVVFLLRLAVFVFPVRGHTFFRDAMHLLGANLYFKRLAAVQHGGVQGLIEIGPCHGDVVLEPARHRAPDMVHDAQGCVTISLAVADNADGKQIVNLFEAALLAHNLAVQGIQPLYASFQLRGNAILNQLGTDGGLHFLKEFLVNRRLVADFLLQRQERLRLQKAEGKVFQLITDNSHSQAMGDRRVDVQGFAGDALLFARLQVFKRAHIVQAIRKLDDDHANIIDHGQKHFANAFSLARLGSHDVEPADFGDAFHQARDFDTEAFFNSRDRIFGVLDGVVKKRGGQRGSIETHIRKNVGNFQEMGEIRIARTAELIVMALRGNFIGAAYHPGIFGRAILAELFQQLVQASIELALGAVAMKMER